MANEAWKSKWKGSAKIYTNPTAKDGRAIVVNHWGVTFSGETFKTLKEAMDYAETSAIQTEIASPND